METEIDLWILFAPVKKVPTEYIIQKATELGASKIFPVITDRTNTKQINLKRMQDIVIEASEQCERLTIPEIFDLRKLIVLLFFLLYLKGAKKINKADMKYAIALIDRVKNGSKK